MRYYYAPDSDAAHTAAVAATVAPPCPPPAGPRVVRPAQAYDVATPGTPDGLRRLHGAAAPPWAVRVTLAVALVGVDAVWPTPVASLALRCWEEESPWRRAFAVYTRTGDGPWRPDGAAVAGPTTPMRSLGVTELRTMLAGEVYAPPPPKPPAPRGRCLRCFAEVPLTKACLPYASHRCRTTSGNEGRS